MKRLFLFLLPLMALPLQAALWTGILDSSRATDWTGAGAPIVNRTTIFALMNTNSTAAQVQAQLDACPSGQVVLLTNGAFVFNNGLIGRKDITLRGLGADQTFVFFTGEQGCFFSAGTAVCVSSGENNYGPNGGVNSALWQAGFSIGTTVITIGDTFGLSAGSQIILDQLDDTVDGYPAAGDIVIAASTTFTRQGGNAFGRSGRAQAAVYRVTGVAGNDVTIFPPLRMPNWRIGKTPGAWWGNNAPLTNFGIENMSMDISSTTTPGIMFFNAAQCWVKGVRMVITNNPSDTFSYVRMLNADHITIRDNYFWGPQIDGTDHYGITRELASDCLVMNNIVIKNPGALEQNGPDSGSVIAYNFATNSWVNSAVEHNAAPSMNLYEGNAASGVMSDITHGTGNFETFFRNFFFGQTPGTTGNTIMWVQSFHRFYNLVGNCLGAPCCNLTYERNAVPNNTGVEIYLLGENGNQTSGGANPAVDARVAATMLRWLNWTSVSNFVSTNVNEVPSGIANFANAVPPMTIPPSFFLSVKPDFWTTKFGTPPWPAIGPDVTNGLFASGHVYKIPAHLVYDNLTNDPRYGTLGVKMFNGTNYNFINTTSAAPTLMSVTVGANGTTWTFLFDIAVQFGAGGDGGWATTINGGPTVTLTFSSGTGTTALVYTGNRALQNFEFGSVAYTQPGDGVESTGLADLASITSFPFLNTVSTNLSPRNVMIRSLSAP